MLDTPGPAASALEELERELRRGERLDALVSLIVLDVDDLALLEERRGREAARDVLLEVDRLIDQSCRETDLRLDVGSGDFAIILPAASKLDAGAVADRLRRLVERTSFPDEGAQPDGTVTVSLGVATFPADASDATRLAANADRALYLAKASGKNRVQLYDDNRRSRQRLRIALAGGFSTLEVKHHPLTTVDVSPRGLRFQTDRELPVDALLDVRVNLDESGKEINMAVRVVRVEELQAPSFGFIFGRPQSVGGRYEIAARALEISAPDLRAWSDFLGREQPGGRAAR